MRKSIILTSVTIVVASFFLMSFANYQQKKAEPWPVPAEYKTMANPVKADDASVKLGMAAYNKNCASCHGKVRSWRWSERKITEDILRRFFRRGVSETD
jgi:cytochrome c5